MSVVYINYKIAICDICGKTEEFDSVYSKPLDWNSIEDEYGSIRYKCICMDCTKKIRDYIENFLSSRADQVMVVDVVMDAPTIVKAE